ncbi:hypothetical protein Vretimale_7603 [Volvox reticuliferus]|uniref:Uncharacterized protein n=1 Tax=Volvox reticuliferus TaxID=1737510 RepID=A0A8J4CAX9_9CHLO|nr:hypothetical protein Vretifemale_7635 [Volvox reticuliferus]GIM02764.1 hypothetical protein Vretimale_7603 [Volvox reticuliferus]
MVRLTYVLEAPAPVASNVQPVNLAFAAAAVARASWASKEREDNLWDFETLDDGAVGNIVTLADGVLDGSTFANFVARNTDTGSAQPVQPQRSSGVGQTLGFVTPMMGTSALSPDAPGIHEIPRNSVLFRTHAAQQTMNSSLPPAEPNAPTAIEVAAVMEERKSRGFLLLPDEIITPPPAPPPRAPQRSASFSPGLGSATPEVQPTVENGSASTGCNTDQAGSHKALDNQPYASGNGATSTSSPVVGGTSPDGMAVSSIDDRGTGPVEPDGEGDGERDGCLVLPVLRTLLAMQDDSPRSFPPSRPNIANGSLSRLQSLSVHSHGGGHAYGHGSGGGTQTFAGLSLGASTNFSRQASVHALRASPSAALTAGSGVSIGGGVTRQSTLVNNTSPARRRVVVGGSAAAAANEPPSSIMRVPGGSTPRRQATITRVSLSYPAGYAAGNAPPQDDDDFPVLGSGSDPAWRTVSHTASASPLSPMQSSSNHPNGKYLTRSQVASPLSTSAAAAAAAGGGATDPVQMGDSAAGIPAMNGRGASPPQAPPRQGSHATAAAAAARTGPVKASQQSIMQQQGVQTPPIPSTSSAPTSPLPQTNPAKSKPGKALFAWTHKIGKGKWPWFPGGSSNAAAATAGPPPPSGPVSPVPNGNGTTAGGQELLSASAHALSGPNTDTAAAAALQSNVNGDRQLGGTGHVSGNGRQSNTGVVTSVGQQPPPQQAAALAGHVGAKDPVQLPPIELHARRRPTAGGGGGGSGEPLSPVGMRMGNAVTVGGGGGGGAFGKR